MPMAVSPTNIREASREIPGPTAWEEVVAPVRPFLQTVSERLAAQADTFDPEVATFARYALDNRGKQLRPALVGLAGSSVGSLGDQHVNMAIIVEMIHLATLVHDDIMDEATIRRRRPTLAAQWGNEVAVLVGDCLFAHALGLATQFDSIDISQRIATAARKVCSGEILQTLRRQRWKVSRAEYLHVIELKTAELFALACEMGARLANGSPQEQVALSQYGRLLGIAYQIYDDCLDLFGTEGMAGKSLGTDLATGKLTLPLLIFLERATPAESAELTGWLERWDPARFSDVRSRLEACGALAGSVAVIQECLAEGNAQLSCIPAGPSRDALMDLSAFLAHQTAALGG